MLASVIPYTLELAALRRLPRAVFGVLLSLEPAIAATAGWLLLAQPLDRPGVAVGVVVLASAGSTLAAAPHGRGGAPDRRRYRSRASRSAAARASAPCAERRHA